MQKHIIGIMISLIGIGIMGYEAGREDKIGQSNESLHFIGLGIVFFGILVYYMLKRSEKEKKSYKTSFPFFQTLSAFSSP